MKLVFIAPASSIHTIRWVNSLIKYVDEVHLISAHLPLEPIDNRVYFHKLKYKTPLGYFTNVFTLKKLIKVINPDIINTHYLSGYGTLTAFAYNGKYPYLLSMWGSDIYDFPKKNLLNKKLIEWVSKKATALASTSYVMKDEFKKTYPNINKNIFITPFGVDSTLFSPNGNSKNSKFTIGIAKVLEDKYGIEYLIKAFLMFNKTHSNSELQIIGDGKKRKKLEELASNNPNIKFYGRISNHKLPQYINDWNVCVLPSVLDSESFGVSAVEASSCGVPVIASNVGGLKEVIIDGKTGFLVAKKNPEQIHSKLLHLYNNKELQVQMGKEGRALVLEMYEWDKNVLEMVSFYKKISKL